MSGLDRGDRSIVATERDFPGYRQRGGLRGAPQPNEIASVKEPGQELTRRPEMLRSGNLCKAVSQ
jgi:hypothetical protein